MAHDEMSEQELKADRECQPHRADEQGLSRRFDGPSGRDEPDIQADKYNAREGGHLMGHELSHESGVSRLSEDSIEDADEYHGKPGEKVFNNHVSLLILLRAELLVKSRIATEAIHRTGLEYIYCVILFMMLPNLLLLMGWSAIIFPLYKMQKVPNTQGLFWACT